MWPNAPNVRQKPSKLWGLPPLVLGISVELLLDRVGHAAIAKPVGASVAAISFVAIVGWQLGLNREQWFWPFIAAASVVHVGAVFLVPWPNDASFEVMLVADVVLTVIAGATISKLWKPMTRRAD